MILSVDLERNRISFGLKSSYLNNNDALLDDKQRSTPHFEIVNDDRSSSPDLSAANKNFPSSPDFTAKIGKFDTVIIDALESTGFNWDNSSATIHSIHGDSASEKIHGTKDNYISPGSHVKGKVEIDHTLEIQHRNPQSSSDFERLLLGSPNSSILWIRYASFYAQLSDIPRSREVLRRSLRTIHFREEKERFNIWMALLNLESSFGDNQSLDCVFNEAAKANDSKTTHLRLASIQQQAGKSEDALKLYQNAAHKFGQSSKVWTSFAEFRFQEGNCEEARQLLSQSLTRLEKRKHVKTITKFSQLEFKLGDPERGRTIFEGILESYPKRMDLWFVYVDMEIRGGELSRARAIFDRLLRMKLTPHKAKSVFKKWLSLEKQHGNPASVETVKSKAIDWNQENRTAI